MSLHRPTRRPVVLGALVSVLLAVVAPAARAQATVTAWTRVERTTTDSGKGRAPLVVVTRTISAGAHQRMEQIAGADSATPRMIMLTDTAAHTILSIMPAQHMAMLMEIPRTTIDDMREMMPLKPVGKPEVHVEELGDGPSILGHPTKHYRTTRHAVEHVDGGTISCDRTSDTRTDTWATLDSLRPPHTPRAPRVHHDSTAVPAFDSAAMAEMRRVRGFPLRTESVATVKTDSMPPSVVRTTTEVTQVGYVPVDTTAFSPPKGYAVMDQRPMMAAMDQTKMHQAMAPMMALFLCGSERPTSK